MRLYSFVNMYLSPIQHGIQTAHVVSELSTKQYADTYHKKWCQANYTKWAQHHKTIIVLNGGYGSNLYALETLFSDTANVEYPWAAFNEERDALDGARTAIGIVLPEKIYNLASSLRETKTNINQLTDINFDIDAAMANSLVIANDFGMMVKNDAYTEYDIKLAFELNNYRLA